MQVGAQALLIGFFAAAAVGGGTTLAEQAPAPAQVCPQDETGRPPPSGGAPGPTDNLSDRLAASKGVICPPVGIDPDIRVKPPSDEGTIKIVPAPDTPGNAPKTQPN